MGTTPTPAEKAIKAYKNAEAATKKLLEEIFGDDHFRQDMMSRIKSMEDVCNEKGLNPDFAKRLSAFEKMELIVDVLNEGWVPDYGNGKQPKYYPWFKYVPGSGWSYHGCDGEGTGAAVGARLVFKSAELAKYAGEQFLDIYSDFLTKK